MKRPMRATWRLVADHLGKILSAIGAALLSLDVLDYADTLKLTAQHLLGHKGAQKIGLALFILLFLRTAYTGWKASRSKR